MKSILEEDEEFLIILRHVMLCTAQAQKEKHLPL